MPKTALDEHLQSKRLPPLKPEPPPKWKRGRWDATAGHVIYPERPPTKKQILYLRDLSRERGTPFVRPKTRVEAMRAISRHARARRAKSLREARK